MCSDPAGLALLMVSVTCVPKSAASCPSSYTVLLIAGAEPQEPSRVESLRAGLAAQSGLGPHALFSPQAQHFTHVRTLCRGSSSEIPPGRELAVSGICEEGRRKLSVLWGSFLC